MAYPSDPQARERMRSILAPLFVECRELDFRGGVLFRGEASHYCLQYRRQVAHGLRQLGGGHYFEELDGRTYLTYAMPGPDFKPVNKLLHLVLFAATVLTTLVAGASWRFESFLAEAGASLVGAPGSPTLWELGRQLVAQGGPFSLAILLILGTHECGHYLMARRYGMLVTPPFFLPAPIPPIGTFGAVIRMRSPMLHRRALLDIGLAGPLAGLAVALPFFLYGLSQCQFEVIRYWEEGGGLVFGNSLFTWGASQLLVGSPPPGYALNWLSHPFAWAGWIGLLVTMLNLIPVGQLDGGHVAYALVGRRQRLVAWFFLGVLIALGQQWGGWLFWCVVMVLLMRVAHPPVVIEEVTLGRGRRALAWAALAIFILLFMPAPVRGVL